MWSLLLVAAPLGFVVFCVQRARSVRLPFGRQTLTIAIGPITLASWMMTGNDEVDQAIRVGWQMVIITWFLALNYDRLHGRVGLLIGWVMMALIVLSVDRYSSALFHKPWRRVWRAMVWPLAVADYLSDADGLRAELTIKRVWLPVILGWSVSFYLDRFGPILRGK